MHLDLAHKLSHTNKSQTHLVLVSRTMLSQKGPMILEINRASSRIHGPDLLQAVVPLHCGSLTISLRQQTIDAMILSPANVLLLKILSTRDPCGSLHATAIGKIPLAILSVMSAMKNCGQQLMMMQNIERERNLLNSKLVEFENFLRNPYRGPAGSAAAQQIPFPGATTIVLSPTTQNTVAPQSNVPPSVSSFSQLGASLNTGFSPGPSVFSANNVPSANAFSFGNQQPNQSVAASFPTNMANFSNSSAINPAINQFSAAAVSTQNFSSSSIQSPAFLNVSLSNSEAVGREATNVQLGNNLPTTVASGDSNIWLKEKWTPGEIPEEAPPDAYV
ncbi:hypothetical protein ERO13_D04G008200v2 [Gossypium hirsutum]|uniref:Zinc finger CCCH domain-containing protein 16 isoform X3 n=1 Tax=Gossypium hirsutum TaxID=3635 RepID=A0ABM2ZY34_GOSHI|nr:zinc finger CCCH domain-containing protein 16 isoform X3 [Gossypium hirsutum]KAG4150504.1 hypothetical protein ERO13_D04G008200v2 [Gossypium hirsutum]